jgi:hypothetical protein
VHFSNTVKVSLFSLIAVTACQRQDHGLVTPSLENGIQNYQYTIYELDYFDKPYTSTQAVSLEMDCYTDSNGVPLFQFNGQEYYHPVNIAQKTFPLINSYVLTQDSAYLNRAEYFIKVLIDSSHLCQGARFYPYQFDFPLHTMESQVLLHPWYSGMAQGHLLTALSRLYQITHKEQYAVFAHETFRSYFHFYDTEDPWIMILDPGQFMWIEEYPMFPPDRTLNGFIFSIYGLYDYYCAFKTDDCRLLLQQSITTIQHYISDFRNPGGPSYYCLKHNHIDAFYHTIHINQLRMLFKITKEQYFEAMADSLYADYHS